MDAKFCYTVVVETDDRASLERWAAWIVSSGHLSEVCAVGPLDAQVVILDGTPHTIEVRYHFTSRAEYETYEREKAPALRLAAAKAIEAFGSPIRFRRHAGELAAIVLPPTGEHHHAS